MLGELFKGALLLGSYAASSVATRKIALAASSRLRQGIKHYAKAASHSKWKFERSVGNVLDRGLNTSGKYSRTITVGLKYDSVRPSPYSKTIEVSPARKFIHNLSTVAHHRLRSNVSRSKYRWAMRAKKEMFEEMTFMPANYMMYKAEKHRAVTPEQKESTSSFSGWYFGSGIFAMSMGAGIGLRAVQKGAVRKTSARVGKAVSFNARKLVFKGMTSPQRKGSAVGAAISLYETALAGRHASLQMTENRGLLSLVGSGRSFGSVVHDLASRTKELRRTKYGGRGRKSMLQSVEMQLRNLSETIDKQVSDQIEKGYVGGSPQGYRKQWFALKENIIDEALQSYQKEFSRRNKSMNSWNKMLRRMDFGTGHTRNQEEFLMRRQMRSVKLKDVAGHDNFVPGNAGKEYLLPEDPGKYTIGGFIGKMQRGASGSGHGRRVDFGHLNVMNIRDELISGATRGVPGFMVKLFGQHEMLLAKRTEHALGFSHSNTGMGSIYLPTTHHEESAVSAASKMFGLGDDKQDLARAIVDSRQELYRSRGDLKELDSESFRKIMRSKRQGTSGSTWGDALFSRSASHGEFLTRSSDQLVHMPGGGMKLLTTVRQGNKTVPVDLRLGGLGNGQFLDFLKYTSESSSIPGKAQRYYLGQETLNIPTKGLTAQVPVGPTPIGAVRRDAEEFAEDLGAVGFIERLSRKLDLGRSESRSIFNKIASIFKKHANPSYMPTFLRKQYIHNEQFVNQLVSSRRSLDDTIKMFRDESESAWHEIYGQLRRQRGAPQLQKEFNSLFQHINVQAGGMIHQDLSAGEAAKLVDDFFEHVSSIQADATSRHQVKHFLSDDLREISRISSILHGESGAGKTVLDTLGSKIGGDSIWIKGMPETPTLIDTYNSMVMRINYGNFSHELADIPEFITTDAGRAMFSAGNHLSRIHHSLASEFYGSSALRSNEITQGTQGRIREILESQLGASSKTRDEILKYYKRKPSHWSFAWSDKDLRPKVEGPDYNEILLIPKTTIKSYDGIVAKKRLQMSGEEIAVGVMNAPNVSLMTMLHSFNRSASEFLGIGFDETTTSTPGQYFKKMFTKRVVPTMAGLLGYSVLDRTADNLLDGTPFGEGLTTFGANMYAGARVTSQGILDSLMVTDAAKYFEDLLPGAIQSPASGLARGFGPVAAGMSLGLSTLGPQGAIMGGAIGGGIGLLLGGLPLGVFGSWDISKSRRDVVQELTGEKEVAVRKGRWWELGCLSNDTMVKCEDGWKPACQVQPGDRVVDRDGEYSDITEVKTRYHSGEVFEIRTYANLEVPTTLTSNHVLPRLKRYVDDVHYNTLEEIEITEVQVGELNRNDFLEIPLSELPQSWDSINEYQPSFYYVDGKLYCKIHSITPRKYDGIVYDFVVNHPEHMFQAGHVIVHNSTPFEGTRISYFRPHMYALQRSKYKETPDFKDSIITEILGAIAPDYYAAKHYHSRPYPMTAGLLSDIPVFSSMAHIIAPELLGAGHPIHGGDISPTFMQGQARENSVSAYSISNQLQANTGPFAQTDEGVDYGWTTPGGNMTERPLARSSRAWSLGETEMNIKDIVGLRGFIMGSIEESITGRNEIFDYAPELPDATDVGGIRRSYWDMELGGILGSSEIIRRYIPHRRNQIQLYNPIRNTMPTWLPGEDYYLDFKHGDPFTVVPMGEARLPGAGYESLHDVEFTFPIAGDILGEDLESQVGFFLGYPAETAYRNKMHSAAEAVGNEIAESAQQYGDLLSKSPVIYSPEMNIHASVDAILQSTEGNKVALKVVPRGFAGESSINAFMALSDVDHGILMEVDPESGGIIEKKVRRDMQKFHRDLQGVNEARNVAMSQVYTLDDSKKAYNLARGYSWFNRYKILADVGQWSEEFKMADAIVQQQMQAGVLNGTQVNQYWQIQDQMREKQKSMETHEYRFMDLGDSLTEYGRQRDKVISEEYNILERTVGAGWEYLTHLRTPLHSKLMHKQSAFEEYQNTAVYGKRIKMWENPIEDYIYSYANRMVAEDDPVQAALSWGIGGMTAGIIPGLAGGLPLAMPMAAIGASVGLFNTVTGNVPIPTRTEETREMREQLDALKYAKNQLKYQETGDRAYLYKGARTITSAYMDGAPLSPFSVGRYLGYPEKDFAESILNNVSSSNIERVSKILPEPAVATMYAQIGLGDKAKEAMAGGAGRVREREIPAIDNPMYRDDLSLESVAIQTMEMEGLESHDAGLGWYDQMSTLNREAAWGTLTEDINMYSTGGGMTIGEFEQRGNIIGRIRDALSSLGDSVTIVQDGKDTVTIEIMVN